LRGLAAAVDRLKRLVENDSHYRFAVSKNQSLHTGGDEPGWMVLARGAEEIRIEQGERNAGCPAP
jgi:hypothetical protein